MVKRWLWGRVEVAFLSVTYLRIILGSLQITAGLWYWATWYMKFYLWVMPFFYTNIQKHHLKFSLSFSSHLYLLCICLCVWGQVHLCSVCVDRRTAFSGVILSFHLVLRQSLPCFCRCTVLRANWTVRFRLVFLSLPPSCCKSSETVNVCHCPCFWM